MQGRSTALHFLWLVTKVSLSLPLSWPRYGAKIIWHWHTAMPQTHAATHTDAMREYMPTAFLYTWFGLTYPSKYTHTRSERSTPILCTQCWLLGASVLGMQGRTDKEFEFLAGLSVKVIKPLLMHPFVVAVSSSVTFIKYVQLNVTERGSSLSCP